MPKPDRLTAAAFCACVRKNSSWCDELTSALEITEFCDLSGTGIKCLSRFLIFSGRDRESGRVADFSNCPRLDSAQAVFHGGVDFSGSGISSIANFVVTQPDKDGRAAQFERTKNLRVAEGIFCGSVNFTDSAVSKIGRLIVARPNKIGDAARFSRCANLAVAEGAYPGFVSFSDSSVSEIGCLVITQPGPDDEEVEFDGCEGLSIVEGILPGYVSASKSFAVADQEAPPKKSSGHRSPFMRPGPGHRPRNNGLRLPLPPSTAAAEA